jgi:malate dehydrogenase (oxaloacetate-decarboxylating)
MWFIFSSSAALYSSWSQRYDYCMDKVYEDALALHKKHHGKLEVRSKVPIENKDDLSLAYTPGVAQVSVEIGKNPESAREYTLKHNTIAVVSDGSAILGLGNLGAEAAIPVMEGKAILFKKFADIDAFPICLATQDVEEIIETTKRIAPVFGGINLEDISAPRCFEVERRLRAELSIPVMHDDQHGTSVVVLAALINALKLRAIPKEEARIVMSGAGAAGTAVARLLLEYGIKDIVLSDSKGAIHQKRADLTPEKKELARITNPRGAAGGLAEILVDADVFIGVSKGGILSEEMVRSMHERPIVLALANPIPEIMPDAAKRAGAFIVATGRSDFPNQINNVLAFPGIFRGALDHGVKQFTSTMFLRAAEALAGCVKHPDADHVLPSAFDTEVVRAVAASMVKL